MEEIATWLCRVLRPSDICFEPLKPTPQSAEAGLLPPDPLSFTRGFINARRIAHRLGVDCVYSALSDEPRLTFCPVGQDTFIVAPDGSIRSCYLRRKDWEERGLDFRLGKVTQNGKLAIDQSAVQRLRDVVANRSRCERCFCRFSCAGGCLVTETPPGHGLQYTDYCRQTRLIQTVCLLENLGMEEHADALLKNDEAVSRLWMNDDDRLVSNG
jgi:radical SAM protein with 4Fe4S-binding SPASM domain